MRSISVSAFILLLLSHCAQAALTADNLLLIVNRNVPQSQALADHYAKERQVPAGRIVALDLPAGDEISIEAFDRDMVAPIRQFLAEHRLENQIRCIVTFYGVPLRIPARTNSAELRAELVSLRAQMSAAAKQATPLVEALEKLAVQLQPTFTPLKTGALEPADALPRRSEVAGRTLVALLEQMPAGANRDQFEATLKALSEKFKTVSVAESPTTSATILPSTQPAPRTQQEFNQRVVEMTGRRSDPEERRAMRDFVRQYGGILPFLQVLHGQEQYLVPDDSTAAVDNEMALLWWGLYPRQRWQPNPLSYRYPEARGKPTLMVMRLDAAKPEQVQAIIDTSIKVEREGLGGQMVVDSRGIAARNPLGKADAFGPYDQTIRNLATLVRTRTKLKLLADDQPALIAPDSVKDCGVYCGWYSPAKYVPSVAFVPGGVAMHIASYEMTTLHQETTAWCPNLLSAGAVATLGPVAEPYLHAFPQADDFFPVLLTGKMTLAETYWVTNPLTSWMMTMVGDPLYTPFKTNPAIKPEDLPDPLRRIFIAPTTQPRDR